MTSTNDRLFDAVRAGDLIGVKSALADGASANAKADGVSALHEAAMGDSVAVCKCLVEAGANLKAKDRGEAGVLHFAADGGNAAVCQYLLQQPGIFKGKDNAARNPLHWAAGEGNLEACRLFLKDKRIRRDDDNAGRTALDWAAMSGNAAICQLLLDEGFDPWHQDHAVADMAVHRALEAGAADAVRVLLNDVDARTIFDGDMKDLLHVWCSRTRDHQRETLKVLLAAGFDVTQKYKDKDAAIHLASKYGNSGAIAALLANGVDIDVRGNRRRTALMIAVEADRVDCVTDLLEAGASHGLVDETGLTARDIAEMRTDEKMVALLRSHEARETLRATLAAPAFAGSGLK